MENPQNSTSPTQTSASPKPLSMPMGTPAVPSSQAATPTTTTSMATQSSLPKSVEPVVPAFVQPDLDSRPVSPLAQPTSAPVPQVKKSPSPSTNVQPSVNTTVVTPSTPVTKTVAPHPASKQHMSADITSLNTTAQNKIPFGASSNSSQPEKSGELELPQPVMYIIIAGIALAVFLAGFFIWSCVQKRKRNRTRKISFTMSQASEKEWGTTKEMAEGMENVYRHSIITYDPKAQSKLLYEDLDFGPLITSQISSQKELNQYKKDTIVCLTDVYGSTKGWNGSEFDYLMTSPSQFAPVSAPPGFIRTSPEHIASLPKALLTGNHLTGTGHQQTVPGFRPYASSSGRLLVQPLSSIKMSPAEASNELQKIVNAQRNYEDSFDNTFDSPQLSGTYDDTPIQTNPEHFPVLLGSFPAARKLSSAFLPGADKSLPKEAIQLPLPRYNLKETSTRN
ncbi:hypothetical protein PtB15_7B86 [Puccinia triticina]|nr:hypothetical protein PtB15_7B86 [Puccinia triticina]